MESAPLRVLMIGGREDDYVVARKMLSQGEARAHQLSWAPNREEGLRAIAENRHDVCLVSSELGEEGGIEVLGEIVAGGCTAPVILIAERQDCRAASRAMDAGAADVLVRGQLTPQLLERSLRYAVEGARARQELRESRERYDVLTGLIGDGVWEWNLQTDRVVFSAQWRSILGCQEGEIGADPEEWFKRIHPNDVEKVRAQIASLRGGQASRFQSQHRLLHREGSYRWVLCRGAVQRDEAGGALRLIGALTDITDARTAGEGLPAGGQYDALTGLPDRDVLKDRLRRAIARAKRRGDYMFAVVFVDLDRFKVINDSLGRVVGDQLLVTVARRLEACMRATDTLARLAGDEFALLLEDIRDVSDALRVADRVQEHLGDPFNLRGHEVFTSASMGIALSTKGYAEPDDLLRDADIAMSRAKAQGKARHEIFDKDMHERAVERLELESGLRRAVERNEFIVHYQPIVSLRKSRLVGFEALVRWQHPERGLLPPGDFLPVAEETGLIVPIDRWVLREACRQLQAWREAFPKMKQLSVSVNLSRRQLAEEDLPDYIRQNLEETGLDPEHLRPEITESQIMADVEAATAMLDKLKDLNVHLHMDDFGTGYSSLSHLIRFNIDTLKIDGSFVGSMDVRAENFEIVRMIISLAHNLGMAVIAEGVETAEQRALLRTLKCEYGQGFFFSRPVDAATARALVEGNPKW